MNFPYILIIESEPQFVALKDMVLYTPKGEVFIEECSPIGLLKTEEGILNLGKAADILEFNNRTVIKNLLENCQPANFELIRDSNGDSAIKPILLEEKVLLEDKISRIPLRENVPEYTLKVQKIRL